MMDVYVLAERLLGFTWTLRVIGRLPVLGVAVTHASAVVTVYVGFPALGRTDTFWAAGNVELPI
jgi:hypothetical protein